MAQHAQTISRGRFLTQLGAGLGLFVMTPTILTSCGGDTPIVPQPQTEPRDVVAIAKPSQTVLNVAPIMDSRQTNGVGYAWGTVTIATANFQGKLEQRQFNTQGPDVFMLVKPDAVDFVEPTATEKGYLIVKDNNVPYAVITSQTQNGIIETVNGTDKIKRIELYAEAGTKILTNVAKTTTQGSTMKEIFINKLDETIQRTAVGFANTAFTTTSGFAVLPRNTISG